MLFPFFLPLACVISSFNISNQVISLREECKPKVFEKRILRRIFGPKRNAIEGWRRLSDEKLHILYRSSNIVRMIKSKKLRWAGHLAEWKKGKSACIILTGNSTGKRLLGKSRYGWKLNIEMDLKEMDINTRNWIELAQNRDHWSALNLWVS